MWSIGEEFNYKVTKKKGFMKENLRYSIKSYIYIYIKLIYVDEKAY